MAGGRPSKYKEEYVEQARKFALLGATNERMAELFDVGIATFNRWLSDKPEFRYAIKEGRDVADANVAASLYHRACGFHEVESSEDKQDNEGNIITLEKKKYYPPDTAAAFIWLKNRQPQRWRDKPEEEQQGNKIPTDEFL